MIERLLLVLLLAVAAATVAAVIKWRQRSKVQRLAARAGMEYRDQAVPATIVAFGSADCKPCTLQDAEIEELLAQPSETAPRVVHVDVDQDPDAARAWQVFSLPTTYVVDASGSVRAVNNGVARAGKLRRQLAPLMAAASA